MRSLSTGSKLLWWDWCAAALTPTTALRCPAASAIPATSLARTAGPRELVAVLPGEQLSLNKD